MFEGLQEFYREIFVKMYVEEVQIVDPTMRAYAIEASVHTATGEFIAYLAYNRNWIKPWADAKSLEEVKRIFLPDQYERFVKTQTEMARQALHPDFHPNPKTSV